MRKFRDARRIKRKADVRACAFPPRDEKGWASAGSRLHKRSARLPPFPSMWVGTVANRQVDPKVARIGIAA